MYLLPIIPNPNEYITSIINVLLPIFYGYRIYIFYKKEKDDYLDRNYNKKNINYLITVSLITIILVYFSSGYFNYWIIAVATNSMNPSIKIGDAVFIEKINKNYEKIKTGDVIVFKYQNIIIVHRVIKIINENKKYYFYTKGDNNSIPDNFVIEENMIIGKVNYIIPKIGIPTVLVNGI